MTRGILVLLALAGLATAAAAALTTGMTQRRPASVAAKDETPVWGGKDRIFVGKAQLIEARARGQLDRDVKSILNVRERMQYGDYVWNDRNVPNGPVWVRIDLDRQILSVFRDGHEVGTAVVLYGADEKETPAGVFPVLAKIKDHESSIYDAKMPYTLRLTGDGVSIHASDVRWGRATHGCIGVPPPFARKLFDQVSKGDEVVILSDHRSRAS